MRLLFDALVAAGRDARALANATVAAIGPGTAGGAARARRDRRRRPRALDRRGAGRGAGRRRRRRAARARRARRRGPRRAPRRAARARRRGRRRRAVRDGRRGPRPARRSRPPATPTTSPSPRRPPSATCSPPSATASRNGARVVSIGPVTSETAREAGLEVHVEAERHDPEGVVEALLADARRPTDPTNGAISCLAVRDARRDYVISPIPKACPSAQDSSRTRARSLNDHERTDSPIPSRT